MQRLVRLVLGATQRPRDAAESVAPYLRNLREHGHVEQAPHLARAAQTRRELRTPKDDQRGDEQRREEPEEGVSNRMRRRGLCRRTGSLGKCKFWPTACRAHVQ